MKFILEQSEENLPNHPGMIIVGELLSRTSLRKRLNSRKLVDISNPYISNADIICAYIGLLCQGKSDFDNIEPFRYDPFYKAALKIKTSIPASSTLGQRLRLGGLDGWDKIITNANVELLINANATISPIPVGKKDAAKSKAFGTTLKDHVCLDIDVSAFDNSKTKKEGVGTTYQSFAGFSPIFAYLGQEGYCINVELRAGKDHSQKNTPSFLSDSIDNSLRVTDSKILVRMDSGYDSLDNIIVCRDKGVDFIIKRNLRKESKEHWFKTAKELGTCQETRPGKKVYTGHTYIDRGLEEPVRVAFQVTERTTLANGQYLALPDLEVCTFWTSLDVDPENIFMAYRGLGTSEQFHSEIKTDLDLERLPANKFKTNNLVLHLGMLSYNLLRFIGQKTLLIDDAPLRKKVQRKRIRTVIQNIITQSSKFVYHARRHKIRFSKTCAWFRTISCVYKAVLTS